MYGSEFGRPVGKRDNFRRLKKKPVSMKVLARQLILGQQVSSGLTTSNYRISI